jgi:hypothetical protein
MLTLGEVHTGLLQHSSSLPADQGSVALALLPGERVRRSERPIDYVASPDTLTGVDCALATRSGTRTRAVGTVISRACLTGGHILQGSTHVTVTRSAGNRRLPWSHYLSRPGAVETIGRAVDPGDLVHGFLVPESAIGTLDLGALSGRVMDTAQTRARPDRRAPFRMWRTRLRWAALSPPAEDAEPRVRFTVEDSNVRTVAVTAAAPAAHVLGLCEDLALHDWLLTAIRQILDRSRIGALPRGEVVYRLAPAVDHLLHLWMPAARVDRSLLGVWESIERRPGFSRQWQASVDRVRDQVAVSTAALYRTVVDLDARSA